MMRILEFRMLAGPNVFAHRPVLRMELDLEELAEVSSNSVPGFAERLVALLPGLQTHRCSPGYEGGFVERLEEGTYPAHIVEHVALELSTPAGIDVGYGKTVYAGAPGRYYVAVGCVCERAMKHLLRVAVELVEAVMAGREFDPTKGILEARRIAKDLALGPSTRAIVEAAQARGIPWQRLNDRSLVQLGTGKYRKYIQATTTHATNSVAVDIVGDRQLTKDLLQRAGIRMPQGQVVTSVDEACRAAKELGCPVAIKPLDGRQGRGVSIGLTSEAEVRRAFALAAEYSDEIIVEEMIEGRHYRVLVVGGTVVAASERLPAHVIGDGQHTVVELVAIENANLLRGQGHESALTSMEIDSVVTAHLASNGRALDSVPHQGEFVALRDAANLSTGGTARDVTDCIHPDTAWVCERAAAVVGLDVCGIDLVISSIGESLTGSGAILELNAAPGIRMHQHPSEGTPRNVGAAIVDMLYPAGSPTRVPVIAITGTNGKTTTARLVTRVLECAGAVVGMTSTDGIFIGGRQVDRGDTTGPRSATVVLGDPTVDYAVLETARGGILRRGLGFDWADVVVMTNIQTDHIGQDGIETLEDVLRAKALLAERVREGGTLILNAEDELLLSVRRRPRVRNVPKRVVLFGLDRHHPVLRAHVEAGGLGYSQEDGWLVELQGSRRDWIVRADTLPWAFGGAEYQLRNALAAIAATRAQGMSRAVIARALEGFESVRDNPGRGNVYRVGRGFVIVDFGHNPGAFEAVGTMARRLRDRRLTGIVGVPGDRDDSVLRESGRAAARVFDRVIVREDRDRRGRECGAAAEILRRAVVEENGGFECQVVLDECEALEWAIDSMSNGEIVVVFYESRRDIEEVLRQRGAEVVRSTELLTHSRSLSGIQVATHSDSYDSTHTVRQGEQFEEAAVSSRAIA